MKRKNINHKKRLLAYSLLEVMVTLAIFSLLTLILVNTLIVNLRVSRTISNRSRIRNELNEFANLLERDVRNAAFVKECDNNNSVFASLGKPNTVACKLEIPNSTGAGNSTFVWVYQSIGPDHYIYKLNGAEDSADIIYQTASILNIDSISIEKIIDSSNEERATILVTVIASAKDPSWNIVNQVRQVIVSTRNYKVNLSN